MKKEQKKETRRVLARILADELPKDALRSVTGGCTGTTCTSPDGETDRGTIELEV